MLLDKRFQGVVRLSLLLDGRVCAAVLVLLCMIAYGLLVQDSILHPSRAVLSLVVRSHIARLFDSMVSPTVVVLLI